MPADDKAFFEGVRPEFYFHGAPKKKTTRRALSSGI